MKAMIFDSPQGSDAWHQFRSEHFGASEAAAAMGISKYTSRAALLHQKATGIMPEVSPALQAVFNRGHEAEIGGRAMAEEIIGDDLFPATYYIGKLSASSDGLTMSGDVAFEHKQHNAALAESVRNGILPQEHYPQCQQVMLVTGAEKLLFMVSDGTQNSCECMWIDADAGMQAQIIAAWEQVEADILTYVPPEVIPAAIASPQMALPSVSIQVQGSIALIDNLGAFGDALASYVERINKKPETDNDFATLEVTVKTLKSAEEALDAAEYGALAQTNSIDTMRRTVALYRDMARSNRLLIEKLVSQRKEQIKAELISQANDAYRQHIESLEAEISPVRLNVPKPDFTGAAKNKRTIISLRDSLETALANAKIAASADAVDVRKKLAWFRKFAAYEFLFRDLNQVIQKPMEDFCLIATSRIEAHKTAEEVKLEAERQRIQADEEKKARAKIEQEQRAVVAEKEVAVAVAQKKLEEALAPEPTAGRMIAPDHIASAGKVIRRPSDREIIRALCIDFSVSEAVVVGWLKDIDLSCVSIEAE